MARYRVISTVQWEIESNEPLEKVLEEQRNVLESKLMQDIPDARIVARLDKLKEKIKKIRLGEFDVDDVLPYITKDDKKREYEVDGTKYMVRMNSQRYFIFRENPFCVSCGCEGTRMFLEQHPHDKSPHFNLYAAEDDRFILMTKDHIHPRAYGGEDRHSNYQTMCIVCNNIKGSSNLMLDALSQLREVYDENRGKLSKKKLHLLIDEHRKKLSRPWPSDVRRRKQPRQRPDAVAPRCDSLYAGFDLNLWQRDGEIVADSVYSEIPEEKIHVGCIRKGEILEPLASCSGQVLVKLSDGDVFTVSQSLLRDKK